jgi:hypothetical protein
MKKAVRFMDARAARPISRSFGAYSRHAARRSRILRARRRGEVVSDVVDRLDQAWIALAGTHDLIRRQQALGERQHQQQHVLSRVDQCRAGTRPPRQRLRRRQGRCFPTSSRWISRRLGADAIRSDDTLPRGKTESRDRRTAARRWTSNRCTAAPILTRISPPKSLQKRYLRPWSSEARLP